MPPAKKYVLDSDIMIRFLRGDPAAGATIQRLNGSYALSAITYLEVATFELVRDARQFRTVQTGLAQEKLYSLSGTAAKHAARVQAQLKKQGRQMGFQDLCIAATAVEQRAVLVTRNVAHFQLYPGLVVQPW